jgi:hypothetical protein
MKERKKKRKKERKEDSLVYIAQQRGKMCVQIKTEGMVTCHENQIHCAVCCKVNINTTSKI